MNFAIKQERDNKENTNAYKSRDFISHKKSTERVQQQDITFSQVI